MSMDEADFVKVQLKIDFSGIKLRWKQTERSLNHDPETIFL